MALHHHYDVPPQESSPRNFFPELLQCVARKLSSIYKVRYAPLTESISQKQVLTSLPLLIRVQKISCAPRTTFCRSVIPLQAQKISEPSRFTPLGPHSFTCAGGLESNSGLFFVQSFARAKDASATSWTGADCCPVSNPEKTTHCGCFVAVRSLLQCLMFGYRTAMISY